MNNAFRNTDIGHILFCKLKSKETTFSRDQTPVLINRVYKTPVNFFRIRYRDKIAPNFMVKQSVAFTLGCVKTSLPRVTSPSVSLKPWTTRDVSDEKARKLQIIGEDDTGKYAVPNGNRIEACCRQVSDDFDEPTLVIS